MAFISVISACANCHRPFSYNPNLVPSVRVNGVKEPVCESCMGLVNAKRATLGMEPFPILPGAYEACPEGEVEF